MSQTRSVSISASMCSLDTSSPFRHLRQRVLRRRCWPVRSRTAPSARSPVLPGTGLFMPAGSAAMKDKGLFRRKVPVFDAEKCTACLECTLVCPDAAMPSTVHEIDDLVATAARQIDVSEARRAEIIWQGAGDRHRHPRSLQELSRRLAPSMRSLLRWRRALRPATRRLPSTSAR